MKVVWIQKSVCNGYTFDVIDDEGNNIKTVHNTRMWDAIARAAYYMSK